MNFIPPSFEFNGDKVKALSLKGQALTFYNFVSRQADKEGLPFVIKQRTLFDGSTITVTSKKESQHDNIVGKIVITSPVVTRKVVTVSEPLITSFSAVSKASLKVAKGILYKNGRFLNSLIATGDIKNPNSYYTYRYNADKTDIVLFNRRGSLYLRPDIDNTVSTGNNVFYFNSKTSTSSAISTGTNGVIDAVFKGTSLFIASHGLSPTKKVFLSKYNTSSGLSETILSIEYHHSPKKFILTLINSEGNIVTSDLTSSVISDFFGSNYYLNNAVFSPSGNTLSLLFIEVAAYPNYTNVVDIVIKLTNNGIAGLGGNTITNSGLGLPMEYSDHLILESTVTINKSKFRNCTKNTNITGAVVHTDFPIAGLMYWSFGETTELVEDTTAKYKTVSHERSISYSIFKDGNPVIGYYFDLNKERKWIHGDLCFIDNSNQRVNINPIDTTTYAYRDFVQGPDNALNYNTTSPGGGVDNSPAEGNVAILNSLGIERRITTSYSHTFYLAIELKVDDIVLGYIPSFYRDASMVEERYVSTQWYNRGLQVSINFWPVGSPLWTQRYPNAYIKSGYIDHQVFNNKNKTIYQFNHGDTFSILGASYNRGYSSSMTTYLAPLTSPPYPYSQTYADVFPNSIQFSFTNTSTKQIEFEELSSSGLRTIYTSPTITSNTAAPSTRTPFTFPFHICPDIAAAAALPNTETYTNNLGSILAILSTRNGQHIKTKEGSEVVTWNYDNFPTMFTTVDRNIVVNNGLKLDDLTGIGTVSNINLPFYIGVGFSI